MCVVYWWCVTYYTTHVCVSQRYAWLGITVSICAEEFVGLLLDDCSSCWDYIVLRIFLHRYWSTLTVLWSLVSHKFSRLCRSIQFIEVTCLRESLFLTISLEMSVRFFLSFIYLSAGDSCSCLIVCLFVVVHSFEVA